MGIGFTKDIPAGCVLTVVNDDVNAHVLLKGVIDFEKEVVKMEKSRKGIENQISSQEKKMNAKDYASKVPEAVQSADKEKIESLRIELSELNKEKLVESLANFILTSVTVNESWGCPNE